MITMIIITMIIITMGQGHLNECHHYDDNHHDYNHHYYDHHVDDHHYDDHEPSDEETYWSSYIKKSQFSFYEFYKRSNLHELGDVQGEGEHGDGDDVDEQALRVCHRL